MPKLNRLNQYINERGSIIEEHQPIDATGSLHLPNGEPFYLLNVTVGVRMPQGVQPVPVKVKLDATALSEAVVESMDQEKITPKAHAEVEKMMRAHQAQQRGAILAPG
jgi:hypothetical protein